MNYSEIIGNTVSILGEEIKITDSCRTCRRLWGETKNARFYIKVDKVGNLNIIERKVKELS